jgi:hypothetical protein
MCVSGLWSTAGKVGLSSFVTHEARKNKENEKGEKTEKAEEGEGSLCWIA